MKNNIKEIRNARGLSQAKLGELAGMDQRYVDRYEKKGDINISAAAQLASALNVSLYDAFPSEEVKKTSQFDNYLIGLRTSSGLSIAEISRMTGISAAEYEKIEQSPDISDEDRMKIAAAIIFIRYACDLLSPNSTLTSDREEREILTSFRNIKPSLKSEAVRIMKALSSSDNV